MWAFQANVPETPKMCIFRIDLMSVAHKIPRDDEGCRLKNQYEPISILSCYYRPNEIPKHVEKHIAHTRRQQHNNTPTTYIILFSVR
ncbi:hypothetical protein AT251_00500 [Enterovibrio nigricans]|nr:hypothetical protein AT251_00500 [Enterovibrio nigricans]